MNKIIVANWKMNGSFDLIGSLIPSLVEAIQNTSLKETLLIICPPFPYLTHVIQATSSSFLQVGAQDCSSHLEGAYTGDVSPSMLQDIGCPYVILGHSERRNQHQESSLLISQKVSAAQNVNLTTIICIGETAQERENHQTGEVLKAQLKHSLPASLDLTKTIIAYEPVWAIGTGLTPSPEEANKAHEIIHDFLQKRFQDSSPIPILYGGSVTANNARDFLIQPFIKGLLVGGASLKIDQFTKIIQS